MANLPLVAIVGRPNVGKSTFFNRVVGKRISIVQDEPGVTRDRIFADAEWCGNHFTLVDTGGIDMTKGDEISKHILIQADIAVDMSDVILYIVDGKEGVLPSDFQVADKLRRSKKKVILVVNKLDNFDETALYDFYQLGLGDPIGISAEQAKGIGDLLDKVVESLPKKVTDKDMIDDITRIAIVGKPNAGKSSLINKIIGEDRVIVSSIAGTTRDAIDVPFKRNGQKFTLIDTAGLRRKRSIEDESVEKYSTYRTLDAIRRADIVVLVVDMTVPLSEQDVKIAALVADEKKPIVVAMNKWDLTEQNENVRKKLEADLARDLAFMPYYISVYLSALTGKKLDKLFAAIDKALENSKRKVQTGLLNEIIQSAITLTPPPSKSGKRLKLNFIKQLDSVPPSFVLFVNDVTLMSDTYKRYIENNIRNAVDFSGTPITINVKCKSEEDV
ncbi:MAG: ribosome biogenesis GTPase Der [Clostridia bacterium]|nr:ribosome biogenesis GTPase Der [Clostridia bacterium]